MLAPSQWETALLCNDVSHWLGASLESALCTLASPGAKEINITGDDDVEVNVRYCFCDYVGMYYVCMYFYSLLHIPNKIFIKKFPAVLVSDLGRWGTSAWKAAVVQGSGARCRSWSNVSRSDTALGSTSRARGMLETWLVPAPTTRERKHMYWINHS